MKGCVRGNLFKMEKIPAFSGFRIFSVRIFSYLHLWLFKCYHISSDTRNNKKNLDLSYKRDLDLLDCLGRVKLVLQQNFIGLIQLFVVILERGKPGLISKLIW